MRGLKNKRVLITGAASGIGLASAKRFYEEGCELCLVDIKMSPELADLFPERTTFISADVSAEADLQTIQADIETNGLDVLINNAGVTRDNKAVNISRADWDKVIEVNLTAVFRLSQMAVHYFLAGGKAGVILNASSVVAHKGNYGQTNYAASKAGVIAITQSLAREVGKSGIRVNAVAPGFIVTPMTAKVPDKVIKLMESSVPLRRLGQPEEIAAAYAFLASDDAAYITGAVFNVDGGLVI